ncbi:MAG TPA: AMP-binding protein [Steroidobacteraceae bacterium]|nr:AMP-binding protein [Steroidobacteraceae bacterium]
MRAATSLEELKRLEPMLDIERGALEALQLERLRATVEHAYAHNARYRSLCELHGVEPRALRTLADLARFPLISKSELREAYPFGFFAVPLERIARLHASSGTTGKPTVVGYTRRDIETWSALVARSIRAAGGRAGMKVHVAYGYGLFTGGLGAHYGAEAAGCTVIPVSAGHSERQVQLILDFRPDIIMLTPSYMLALLDEFRRLKIDPRSTSLKIGIFGAEPWSEGMRREIEEALDIEACDIYGISEVMGPGVAQELGGTHEGPTVWEDHFLAEIIDPESGEVLPEGALGELVFTSLTKEGMPVVRYRTRDLTRLLPGQHTVMRRLAKISGRSDDMLVIRGVNLFPSQIEEVILSCEGLAPHYELEVTRPHRLDELTVIVEARMELAAAHHPEHARHLEERLRAQIGLKAQVQVVAHGTLGRSSGKAARVRDLRSP